MEGFFFKMYTEKNYMIETRVVINRINKNACYDFILILSITLKLTTTLFVVKKYKIIYIFNFSN